MRPFTAILLAPLGAVYSIITNARRRLYEKGALPVRRVPCPVISVGNLTTGGTGKTPLVEWVARVAAQSGARVCILTRGYGRANQHRRVVVSDRERVLADAAEGGDEPRLLAERLRQVAAVISDQDRAAAALWAHENLGSAVFILDDGFQHLGLARDLDILTIDATNPWGGGRMLPAGRLRESPRSLSRSDCIVITRADRSDRVESLRQEAARLSGGRPLFTSRMATSGFRPLRSAGDRLGPQSCLPIQPVAAFCGLGNPDSFFAQIPDGGFPVVSTRAFPDHHIYTQRDIDSLVAEARARKASLLLTTMKDAVKLRSLEFELECYVLEIEIEFEDESGLRRMIIETIQRQGRSA